MVLDPSLYWNQRATSRLHGNMLQTGSAFLGQFCTARDNGNGGGTLHELSSRNIQTRNSPANARAGWESGWGQARGSEIRSRLADWQTLGSRRPPEAWRGVQSRMHAQGSLALERPLPNRQGKRFQTQRIFFDRIFAGMTAFCTLPSPVPQSRDCNLLCSPPRAIHARYASLSVSLGSCRMLVLPQ